MVEMSGIEVDTIPAEEVLLRRDAHYQKFIDNWREQVEDGRLAEAEEAKLGDEEYWADRNAIFSTHLDHEVPALDISKSIALAQQAIKASGGSVGEASF